MTDDPSKVREQVGPAGGSAALEATALATDRDVGLLATAAAVDVGLLATAAAVDVGSAMTMASGVPGNPTEPRVLAEPPAQGRRLGHYTMIERLGAGAMGVVWRAEDPKLGRHVAVKILHRHDDALTQRLVREARAMAQVNHPNVVTVYEVGEGDDGTTFIAMELISGQSLRAWQQREHHTVPDLVEAYLAAGRGLAAAHAAGIIHRDFKPDNVLVGDDGRVRVTDFGLAAKPKLGSLDPDGAPAGGPAGAAAGAAGQVPAHDGDVNLTASGSVLGTPAYMAPEQFNGGNVDPRTDEFNFCASLYEALYGERPFDGRSFAELGDNVCFGRVKPAPAHTQVSGALRAILLRGLSVKPGDRFATMNDLIVQLGRDRARPWRRTALGAAALAVVLGLGLVADYAARDRISGEIRQSFAMTGRQLDKTVSRLTASFYTVSAVAYREQALREVAGHHDQADFGLGTPEEDQADLEKLHNTLLSTEWIQLAGTHLVIADYKGRLLYTSAAPQVWGTDLKVLAPVKRALDAGKGDSVTVLSYADPGVPASGVLGPNAPKHGLAVLFERTVALGDKASDGSEARALYLMIQDGRQLLDEIRLDDDSGADERTRLALVAPDGTSIADEGVSSELVRAATAEVTEVDGFQLQAREVHGLDGKGTIARVVMVRPLSGVLSLFPGARLVFALTALAALAVAAATFLRARRITGARI